MMSVLSEALSMILEQRG